MRHGLEIKLLNYFLLITAAALMIGVEFYFELNRPELRQELHSNIERTFQTTSKATPLGDDTFAPLVRLQIKILIMFGVLSVVVAIVLMMFVRHITMPLQRMVDITQRINEGDLRQTIPTDSQDEIGELGATINDVTNNLSELAAFSAKTCEEALASLQSGDTNQNQLATICDDLGALKDFADSFLLEKQDPSNTNLGHG